MSPRRSTSRPRTRRAGRAGPQGPRPEKHFPISSRLLSRTVGAVKAVDGVSLRPLPGRDARPGRRVRLRQVDHRPGDPQPAAGHRRAASSSRAASWSGCRAARCGRCAATSRSSSRTRTRRSTRGCRCDDRRRAADHPQVASRQRAAQRGCASCWSWSGSTPSTQPLPARVLRRPAAAHRHRPRARARARHADPRRAGVGAGRLDPGRRDQPARGPAHRARACPTCSSRTTCRWCGTSPTGSR